MMGRTSAKKVPRAVPVAPAKISQFRFDNPMCENKFCHCPKMRSAGAGRNVPACTRNALAAALTVTLLGRQKDRNRDSPDPFALDVKDPESRIKQSAFKNMFYHKRYFAGRASFNLFSISL